MKALWWAHTLALLVFLPLIPHTKHLHLVLSPLTVFLKRDGFSKIPPLSTDENDEDFGLVAGKDVTQLISLQAYSCVECGRCTEHCPASTTGKVLNPKEIILGARTYLNTFGPASEVPLLNELRDAAANPSTDNPAANYFSMEAAFECTTCGACEFQCPVGIQHLPIIIGLRRGATNTGAWEDSYGTKLFLALEKNGNALGLPASERDKFVKKAELPIFDGIAGVLPVAGLHGRLRSQGTRDYRRLCARDGAPGHQLRRAEEGEVHGRSGAAAGQRSGLRNLAEAGLKAFEKAKVQKIVAICPHCVRTIATDWREYGIAPEIEHHSEFMARHKARLPKQEGETIVYHDPCYLGRYQDVYEEPRAVVAQAGNWWKRREIMSAASAAVRAAAWLFWARRRASASRTCGRRSWSRRARRRSARPARSATRCSGMRWVPSSEQPPQLLDIAQLTARALPKPEQATAG